MSILVLTSDTLIGTPATGNIEYNGQFFGTDSNASRAQLQRLVLSTAVASTSGTSIDFTGLPAWVKKITVMFNGVSLSATANILFQLGVGSTPTTTGYQSGQVYVLIGGGGTNGSSSTSGFIVQSGAAAYTLNGSMVFTQLNSSSYIWTGAGVFYNQTSVPLITSASGVVTLSGSVGMVRVTSTSTDTFDAGSINILYEG